MAIAGGAARFRVYSHGLAAGVPRDAAQEGSASSMFTLNSASASSARLATSVALIEPFPTACQRQAGAVEQYTPRYRGWVRTGDRLCTLSKRHDLNIDGYRRAGSLVAPCSRRWIVLAQRV